MYTLQNITDTISLAYKVEKQLTPQPRFYTQKTYTPQLSFEPKTEPQTSLSNSN